MKGIGIILMVIGHTTSPLHDFIYLFHMPLFFMISGFFFKSKYITNKRHFIKKRLYRLYMPFLVWNLFFLVFHNIIYQLGIYPDLYAGINTYISRLIKIFCFTRAEPLLHPLWFLKSLFISSCFMLFVFRLTINLQKKEVIQVIIFIALFICGFIIQKNEGFSPYDLHRELMTMFLIYSGFIIAKYKSIFLRPNPIIAVCFFNLLVVCSMFFTFELVASEIINPILLLLISFLGFYMTFTFSYYFLSCRLFSSWLIYIGKNTMPILILHLIAFKVFSLVLDNLFGLQTLDHKSLFYTGNYNGIWIAFSIVGIVLPLACMECYKKTLSFVRIL